MVGAGTLRGVPIGRWVIVLALGVPGEILANPGGMLVVASMLAVGLVVVVVATRIEVPTSPVRTRAIALRERSRRTAFLRLRDPGAPGRGPLRAPGH